MDKEDIFKKILDCSFMVHTSLGPGLLVNFNVRHLKEGIKRVIL